MAKTVILTICILLVGLVCTIIYLKSQNKSEHVVINWDVKGRSTESQMIELRTGRNGVWHLNLSVTGEVTGRGRLSIGDSDSTIYKVYEIEKGNLKIDYDGDWYAQKCYVIFRSIAPTQGQLSAHAEFVGD